MTGGLRVGFAGMTHLGLNSAAAAATKNFSVVGYDADEAVIESLLAGRLPIREPGLEEVVAEYKAHLEFTTDLSRLGDCDIVYIATDVPTDDAGESNLQPIRSLIGAVDEALGEEVVLVILCQVPPGFTRGLRLARPHLYYQVETLVFGRAIERATSPERLIVGSAEPAQPLPAYMEAYLSAFDCPILAMRYESAELAKIAINCCLVASISAANTLAELSEAIGADWSEIMPALRLDGRIGPRAYIAPGLGIAGGNLERDLATVCRLANQHGTDARVVRAWLGNSEHRRHWVTVQLMQLLANLERPTVAVLGLAYKEDTHSTKNSPALALLRDLAAYRIRAFDPVVTVDPSWHPNMTGAKDPVDACRGADAMAIMTRWEGFRDLDPKALARELAGRLIVDPFAVLDPSRCREAGLHHLVLGRA